MSYYGGSNYPPSNYGGGSNYGYASSGPPPPPGGGYGGGGYGAYQQSAYQQPGYGGGYGAGVGRGHPPPGPARPTYGAPPQPYNPYQAQAGHMSAYAPPPSLAYPGAAGGYGSSGAVPGFTVPQQAAPPPMAQMPPTMQYSNAAAAMQQQSLQQMQMNMFQQMGMMQVDNGNYQDRVRKNRRRRRKNYYDEDEDDCEDEEEDDSEERRREAEAQAKQAQEELQKLQEKLADDDNMKATLRENFIDELLRRQDFNGTFEDTMGTVVPFDQYDEKDPCTVYFQKKEVPTDITGEAWSAEYDAEFLRYGLRGLGTNEDVVIDICATRCNAQRNAVLIEYKTQYGRDLIKDLKSELSGDFKESILACFETPARYDAWCVKKAIYGLGTDELTLIEILLTRTNEQIKEMVEEYNNITYEKQGRSSESIERDITDDTSGDFKRLLISAAMGNRRKLDRGKLENAVVPVEHNGKWSGMFNIDFTKLTNMSRAKNFAQELYKAGEDKWGTDEETFNRIFSTQDYYTLRAVWDQYVKITQRDIQNSIDRETSGDYKKALLAISQVIKCRPMFFAEKLYKAMKGLGTDDSTLIRIVVSRSEIDMLQIKACFLEKYKQTLWNFIKDDTSGDYRKLLCGIVGKD